MLAIILAMNISREPVNIITIKWGPKYGSHYANRLFRGVRRHIERPVRFVCFTDDSDGIEDWIDTFPLPEFDCLEHRRWTNWRKMSLFRDDLPIEGQTMFLDLDLLITGSLDEFFDYGDPDSIPIIHNWIESHKTWFRPRPEIGNSSVFRFKANHFGHLYKQYLSEMEWASDNFRPPQTYLTHCIRPHMCYWPEQWVISFKRHLQRPFPLNWFQQPRKPASDAKIVAFHGDPNPDQALAGYRGKKLHHKALPAKWVEEYWNLLEG